MAKKNVNSDEAKKAKDSSKSEKKKENKVSRYFKDLKAEFGKVVWPDKEQIVNNSTVVLTAIIIIGLFVFGIDTGFTALLKLLIEQ